MILTTYQEIVELLAVVRGERVRLGGSGVGAEEAVRMGELGVDEGELVDWGCHAETGSVGRQQLLVQRVRGYLGFELPLLVIRDGTFAPAHHG